MRLRTIHFQAVVASCAVGVMAVAESAHAHVGFPGMADLWNGALHPFLDISQAVTLAAVGLLLARASMTQSQAEPAMSFVELRLPYRSIQLDAFSLFHICLALSLSIGIIALPPDTDLLGPFPLMLAGLMLINPHGVFTLRRSVGERGIAGLGVLTGLALAAAIPAGVTRLVFACGLLLNVIVLPLYVSEMWSRAHRPWFSIVARILGSWLIAIALMLLGGQLRLAY